MAGIEAIMAILVLLIFAALLLAPIVTPIWASIQKRRNRKISNFDLAIGIVIGLFLVLIGVLAETSPVTDTPIEHAIAIGMMAVYFIFAVISLKIIANNMK